MGECRRHWWEPTDTGYACTECDATSAACSECGTWTGSSLLVCERCLRRWRQVVQDIETAINLHSPAPKSPIPAVRYDRDQITGDRHIEDELRWSLADVRFALDQWAEAWAEEMGESVTVGSVEYLRAHVMWAVPNPIASDWEQWKAEMRHALTVAKREAGILPKRQQAPCAHCGGVAIQTWADRRLRPHTDGLSDEVRCLGCGLTWASPAQFAQLAKQHLRALPEVSPETLVTLDEARVVWPDVPLATWRKWRERGELPERESWDVRGVPTYRLGDLAALAARRADTARRGRRAG